MGSRLAMIVSGGQAGVDRGALDAALERGFACGGWCPEDRAAEDGPIADRYPVTPLPGAGYRERTLRNVLDSDGTLVIHFGELEGGTERTVRHCEAHGRPHCVIDASALDAEAAAAIAREFVVSKGIAKLNVAGPRASKVPRAAEFARQVVLRLLAAPRNRGRLTR